MKKITVQLQDVNGAIVNKREIEVSGEDILIMQFPEDMTHEDANKLFKRMSNALDAGDDLIGLSDGITFQVIKVVDNKVC